MGLPRFAEDVITTATAPSSIVRVGYGRRPARGRKARRHVAAVGALAPPTTIARSSLAPAVPLASPPVIPSDHAIPSRQQPERCEQREQSQPDQRSANDQFSGGQSLLVVFWHRLTAEPGIRSATPPHERIDVRLAHLAPFALRRGARAAAEERFNCMI